MTLSCPQKEYTALRRRRFRREGLRLCNSGRRLSSAYDLIGMIKLPHAHDGATRLACELELIAPRSLHIIVD